jgi:hypothetical protein
MPNWTSNTVRIEGTCADLEVLIAHLKGPEEIFDFNKIIPMPEILFHTASGHCTINGQDVTSWYVIDPQQAMFGGDDNVRLFTPEEEAALAAIGHRDWYSWRIENWGTKWQPCRTELTEGGPEQGYIEFRFETAWDAPLPVFYRLLELFPQLGFDFTWQHEDSDLWYSIERDKEAA